MIALICFVLAMLTSLFKSKSRLEAENAALRQQLNVLRRKMRGRARLTNIDRWFFIQVYRKALILAGSPIEIQHFASRSSLSSWEGRWHR